MKRLLPILSLLSLLLVAGQGCKQFSLNTDDLELSVDMNIIKKCHDQIFGCCYR
ncbi:MAG: hypothetical protein J7L89_05555 [Bacteroidales bacterium]|nr:hypothetical protein [Bacteroidales bacterium]